MIGGLATHDAHTLWLCNHLNVAMTEEGASYCVASTDAALSGDDFC